jgi:hypothetical protein
MMRRFIVASLFGMMLLAQIVGCKKGDPCRSTPDCKEKGLCTTADGGACVVASDEDCAQSRTCKRDNNCHAEVVGSFGHRYHSGEKLVLECSTESNANDKEGCPCGCDHSEEMAAELRGEDGNEALASIDHTLRIIAEREDGGYITEAMVQHRLRLLGLRREIAPATFGSASSRGVERSNESGVVETEASVEDARLRVTADLSAHGEATEIVRGHPKHLRSSFRLGLRVENLSDETRRLDPPLLDGDGATPVVSRWYVLGEDGAPWDGVLAAHDAKRVNVIGYMGEPVAPGTRIRVEVRLGGLDAHVETYARKHWSEPWAAR